MSEIKLLDLNKDWRQARPSLIEDDGGFISNGYQSFKIRSDDIIPISDNLVTKFNLCKNTINEDIVGKSVSDVGCANMFFGFYSAINGASKVIGVDLDIDYIAMNRDLIDKFRFKNIEIKDINVVNYKEEADTVFAFAIMHWVYSCTGFLGSLKNAIEHFKKITKDVLYVEWVDPSDDCISQMLHHLDFNKEFAVQDYNKDNFLNYLQNNFSFVEFLGNSKNTREIYRCLV